MKNKTLLSIFLIFAIILFTSSSFAAENMINDAVRGMENIADSAGNTMENMVDGVQNSMRGVAGSIGNGIDNIGNGMKYMANGAMMSDTNNDYTATRTATTANTGNDTFLGMNATAWGWFIMAALGLSIIGVVWFYGKQHEDGYNPNHEDNY